MAIEVIKITQVKNEVTEVYDTEVIKVPETVVEYHEVGVTGLQGPTGSVDISGGIVSLNTDAIGDTFGNVDVTVEGFTVTASAGYLHFSVIPPVVPIQVNLNGGSSNEIGSVVNSVDLTWSYNESDQDPDTSQTLNQGIGSLPVSQRAYSYTTPISSNTTFTIDAVDSVRGSDSDSTNVTFNLHGVFWGTFDPDALLTEADVEALANNELRTNNNKTFTDYPGGGERFVFAYPKSFGLATVRDGNGFIFADWYDGDATGSTTPYEISRTNSFGYTEDYYVYQTFNRYFGNVTFSFE